MNTENKLMPFADVQKTFGAQGELIIKLRHEAPDEVDLKSPVFIIIDGLAGPFYFKAFDARGNNRVQVIFDDMETQKLAEELVGKQLLMSVKRKGIATQDETPNDLIGFSMIDMQQENLGEIIGFLNIPNNPCLQVNHHGREIIIPFHENFIKKIDLKKRLIQVSVPQELLCL